MKYEFPIPANINGDAMKAHLGAASVSVQYDKLVIESTQTQAQVATALAAYVYVAPVPTAEEAALEALKVRTIAKLMAPNREPMLADEAAMAVRGLGK